MKFKDVKKGMEFTRNGEVGVVTGVSSNGPRVEIKMTYLIPGPSETKVSHTSVYRTGGNNSLYATLRWRKKP